MCVKGVVCGKRERGRVIGSIVVVVVSSRRLGDVSPKARPRVHEVEKEPTSLTTCSCPVPVLSGSSHIAGEQVEAEYHATHQSRGQRQRVGKPVLSTEPTILSCPVPVTILSLCPTTVCGTREACAGRRNL